MKHKVNSSQIRWIALGLLAVISVSGQAVEVAGTYPDSTVYNWSTSLPQPKIDLEKVSNYFISEGYTYWNMPGYGNMFPSTQLDGIFISQEQNQVAFVKFNVSTEDSTQENKLYINKKTPGYTFHGITKNGMPYLVYFISGGLDLARHHADKLESTLGVSQKLSARLEKLENFLKFNPSAYAECPSPNAEMVPSAKNLQVIANVAKNGKQVDFKELAGACSQPLMMSALQSVAMTLVFKGAVGAGTKVVGNVATKTGMTLVTDIMNLGTKVKVGGPAGLFIQIIGMSAINSMGMQTFGKMIEGYNREEAGKKAAFNDENGGLNVEPSAANRTNGNQQLSLVAEGSAIGAYVIGAMQDWMHQNLDTALGKGNVTPDQRAQLFCSIAGYLGGGGAAQAIRDPVGFKKLMAGATQKALLAMAKLPLMPKAAFTEMASNMGGFAVGLNQNAFVGGLLGAAEAAQHNVQSIGGVIQHSATDAAKTSLVDMQNAAQDAYRNVAAQIPLKGVTIASSSDEAYDLRVRYARAQKNLGDSLKSTQNVLKHDILGNVSKNQNPLARETYNNAVSQLYNDQVKTTDLRVRIGESNRTTMRNQSKTDAAYIAALQEYQQAASFKLNNEALSLMDKAKAADLKVEEDAGPLSKSEKSDLAKDAQKYRNQAAQLMAQSKILKGKSFDDVHTALEDAKKPGRLSASDHFYLADLSPKASVELASLSGTVKGQESDEIVKLGHIYADKQLADHIKVLSGQHPEWSAEKVDSEAQILASNDTVSELTNVKNICPK